MAFILAMSTVLIPEASGASRKQASPAQKEAEAAARRAFIRDSLRQERVRARNQAAAEEAARNSAPVEAPAAPIAESAGCKTCPGSDIPRAAASPAHAPLPPLPVIDLPIADSLVVKSLNARQTEIRDVLQGLALQCNFNLLMAPEVAGPISVNLSNIKLKDALRLIAGENGYQLAVVHGAIKVEKRVAPKPEAPPPPRFTVELKDGLLSLDLQAIPAEEVVRRLMEVTDRNILLDRTVAVELTAFIQNLEIKPALRLLAETNGLSLREREGILTFYKEAWTSSAQPGQSAAAIQAGVTVKDNLVSLEVAGAPLAEVISSISAQSGIGTVIYGEPKGNVTLRVVDVPLERAFQILFRGTESTFWVRNGIYFIGPASMQVLSNSKLIVLKHLKVDEVMETLPQTITKDAQLKAVKSQNAIMAMGTYEVIDGIAQYISQIDLPVPQILIEALVVDVDMDKIRNYGVDMFLGDYKRVPSSEHIYPNIDQVFNKERSQSVVDALPGIRDIISLPKNFVAKVEALEQEKALKIRSRPQIATLNGSEATITVGQTQYFLLKTETDISQVSTVTARTTERFEKIEANVTLTVTPFVTGKGEITCDIVPDFSEPEGSFDSRIPPTLNRRVLKSKVRLRDGETIVLGGLVKESVNRTTRQVPFFGSIPLLGWLFKNNSSVTTRSQLMIFVTPHVFYGKDANVDPNAYIKKQSELK